jgi:hypothetical protein
MLRSDHKRILAAAQQRYDTDLKRTRANTIWIAGFAALFALLVGFNFGLSFVQ